jgi:hypothetical protein
MQKLMIAAFALALTALPAAAQTTRTAPKASSSNMRADAGYSVSTDDTTSGTGHNSSFDNANDVGTGNTVGGKKATDTKVKDRSGVDDAEINDFDRSTATERSTGTTTKTFKPRKESKVLAPDDQYQHGSMPPSTATTPSSTPMP